MLINIITTYLQTHKRIVVPQLGAFLKKHPEEFILFTELMKRDDGVLRGLICAEGHSEIEAMGIIDRFVFETRHTLSTEGSCILPGLGVMTVWGQSSIRFEFNPQAGKTIPKVTSNEEQAAPEITAQPAEIIEPKQDEQVEATVAETTSSGSTERETTLTETSQQSESVGRSIGSNPHVSNSAKMNPEPYVRGLRYSKPAKNTNGYSYVDQGSTNRHFDRFLLVALFALAIAVGVIIYGWWSNRQTQQTNEELRQVESVQPVADTPEIPKVES